MLNFDINKIKQKLAEQKEKADNFKNKKKEKNIHTDPLVKVAAAGKYPFRAVPYIHNKDYMSEPFAERFYHFGIPGNAIFYCPAKNNGEKCATCDFVWDQMKTHKGTEEVKVWREFLPKKRVWIPGTIRGREEEGTKFLCLSTQEDKMSKHHQQIFEWLTEESTYNFLDPEVGYDLILKYEEYDAKKSSLFNGATHGFAGVDLARDRTPIAKDAKAFWDEMQKTMPNVDKDIPRYEVKTSKDSEKVLVDWLDNETKRVKRGGSTKAVNEAKDTDGATTVGEDSQPVAREVAKEVAAKSESAVSADDRKAKVKAMLAKKND